jgi:hypothetical protein
VSFAWSVWHFPVLLDGTTRLVALLVVVVVVVVLYLRSTRLSQKLQLCWWRLDDRLSFRDIGHSKKVSFGLPWLNTDTFLLSRPCPTQCKVVETSTVQAPRAWDHIIGILTAGKKPSGALEGTSTLTNPA